MGLIEDQIARAQARRGPAKRSFIDRKTGVREGDTLEESHGGGSWGSSYDDNARLKLIMESGGPSAVAAYLALQHPRVGNTTGPINGGADRDALIQALNGVGSNNIEGSFRRTPGAGFRSSGAGSPSSRGSSMGSPIARPQMRQARDYWRENYDHNFDLAKRRKDMDLEQMYKDKEMQNKLSLISNFLGSRGMKGGNVTESSTSENFVNNAGAYQPVTTHSTSSRNILSEILGRLL